MKEQKFSSMFLTNVSLKVLLDIEPEYFVSFFIKLAQKATSAQSHGHDGVLAPLILKELNSKQIHKALLRTKKYSKKN